MQTFSVEGTSSESLAAAMASAMARIGTQAAHAAKVEVSIASAMQDADGVFRVAINVRAIDPGEMPDVDEEGDGDEGGESAGRERARATRRAERISQEIKENMMHQFHLGAYVMTMDDAEHQVQVMVENTTLDTSEYMPSMADQTERHERDDAVPVLLPAFDTVDERSDLSSTREGAGVAPDSGRITTLLTREVDEVIGLLSLGFYNPPPPEPALAQDLPAPHAPAFPERGHDSRERTPAMPTQPPIPVQPTPGT